MYGNILFLERNEAKELLTLLREKKNSLITGEREDEYRCTDERLYEVLNNIENELVNYSANHCRVADNPQCPYERVQMLERNPNYITRLIRNECSWKECI